MIPAASSPISADLSPIPAALSAIPAALSRSLRRSVVADAGMPIFARLAKQCKTLLNVVKHHETLAKHCDASWNIVKHREPLVKHHEPLVKHHKTLSKHCEISWNTRTLAIRCDNIGAWCGDIGAWRGDIGAHAEFSAILAWSYRRLRCWYNSADV